MKKLKILAFGPQPVYPPFDGGRDSIFGALCSLAENAEVFYAYPHDGHDQYGMNYKARGINNIPVQWRPTESLWDILAATLHGKPFKFWKYSNPKAVRCFASAVRGIDFDIILCFHAHTAQLGLGVAAVLGAKTPVVLREHNVEFGLVQSFRKSKPLWWRLCTKIFELQTIREEIRIWSDVDAVAFLSKSDLIQASSFQAGGRLLLVKEGIFQPPLRSTRHPGTQAPLLILLNPKAAQSVDNLRVFIDHYWSLIYQDHEVGSSEIHVTGVDTQDLANILNRSVNDLNRLRIKGLGFLQDLTPCFKQSLCLLSPTFAGGGIRKKVLEAMANQIPVVASELDIDSTDFFIPGQNILSFRDTESLKSAILTMKHDIPAWHYIASNGRKCVEEHASWHQFSAEMIKLFNDHISL